MNFIRENETKYILSTYKSMTPKNLMEYLLEYNYDNDCVYIFNNLPKEANDEQIKVNDQKLKQLDVMIEFMKQYNKQTRQ
ncbi:putative protein 041L [Cricket iridovirus]|uniref:Uncharacterized protein n=2 Tax=Iridoviridae TaxID=10486 RepID=A0A5B8RM76_9VIRU|nr:putative protein 041L [Iridovirus Liz-CrIV]UIB20853.1 putative protein 041L [Cricket iridovirus]